MSGINDSIISVSISCYHLTEQTDYLFCKKEIGIGCYQYRTCNSRPISSLRRRRPRPRPRRPPLAGSRRHDRGRHPRPRRDELDASGSWSPRPPRSSLCKASAAALHPAGNGAGGGARPGRSPREHGGRPAGAIETWRGLVAVELDRMPIYIHERTDRHGVDDGRTVYRCVCHRGNVARESDRSKLLMGETMSHANTSFCGVSCHRVRTRWLSLVASSSRPGSDGKFSQLLLL
jgi:hypothetical protein